MKPSPAPCTLFIGMAEEERILGHRVAMQVDHQHVRPRVEDLLRAVAVVVVDIEDGDPGGTLVAEPLRGDGGVVDVAIAAHEAGAGVMAGRPAQREGGGLAVFDQRGGGQRHVIGRFDGGPGAGDEGRAGIEGIEAEQRVDASSA